MDQNTHQEKIVIPSINREIVIYNYGEATKKILLAHGWSGSGTQLAILAKALREAGYEVVSFDAPAHGKAPGRISMMPFFSEAIHYLNKTHGPFEAVVAHSLGGMASLKAVKDGLDIKKLVIIGTGNSITHIIKEYAKNMQLSESVAEKMKTYLDGKFKQDMDNYSGAVSAEGVKIPTLVVHDEEDVDVHVSAAHEIHEKLENSEVFITKELGHRRILGNTAVINKIIDFLAV